MIDKVANALWDEHMTRLRVRQYKGPLIQQNERVQEHWRALAAIAIAVLQKDGMP